jgi:DNA replication protein DnaC
MIASGESLPVLERIRRTLVALKMPRALELLDHAVHQLERGEASALELIDTLLAEELSVRENRRIKTALRMARLATIKTLAGFDFSFQPSLDRERIFALAELQFVERREVVHFLGPPGTGKSHLAVALGVEAVKAGRSVYFGTLADIVGALAKAEREGQLRNVSAGSADPRSSLSTRSATCRSSTVAATYSSSSSTPATKEVR